MTGALLVQWDILEQVLILHTISKSEGATGQTEILSVRAAEPQEVAIAAEAEEVAVSLLDGIFGFGEIFEVVHVDVFAATTEPV